jgi:hypothetical protein
MRSLGSSRWWNICSTIKYVEVWGQSLGTRLHVGESVTSFQQTCKGQAWSEVLETRRKTEHSSILQKSTVTWDRCEKTTKMTSKRSGLKGQNFILFSANSPNPRTLLGQNQGELRIWATWYFNPVIRPFPEWFVFHFSVGWYSWPLHLLHRLMCNLLKPRNRML